MSEALGGEAGVTVLSQFPTSLAYYRLARTGAGAFALSARGGPPLACAATSSTNVAPQAGEWLRFRVRVSRFDSRNRIRATVYRDGTSAPSSWQIDCWDSKATTLTSGSVGLYASAAPGTWWDDLRVISVSSDGAPAGYQPATDPPPTPTPTPTGYSSQASLVHWWAPGRDPASPGRDFAWRGRPVDAGHAAKGVGARDVFDGGKPTAYVDLDGKSESLGNRAMQSYGVANTWTLSAWVRPDAKLKKRKKSRYIVDLNGDAGTTGESRISLVLDPSARFAIELSDASGRTRSLSAPTPIDAGAIGRRWYHVVAVKSGTSTLTLYVDGRAAATTDVGVPMQSNAERVLRVGTRAKDGGGYSFAGGVHSIGIWSSALGGAEVRALFANGNRAFDPR
jgi:hypothetical protein